MAKKDLVAEAKAKGIELTGKETIPQLVELLKEPIETEVSEPVEVVEPVAEIEPVEIVEAVEELTLADKIKAEIDDMQKRHDAWKARL